MLFFQDILVIEYHSWRILTWECWSVTSGFLGGASGKEPACQCRRHEGMRVRSLGREDLPEKEMATHSSPLAWKMLWTVEPGRLQSMGHKESDMTEQLHFHFHWEAPKCLRTTKPKRRNYRSPPARELCSTRREATAMRSWSTETRVQPPLSATRESPHTATKTQGSQK